MRRRCYLIDTFFLVLLVNNVDEAGSSSHRISDYIEELDKICDEGTVSNKINIIAKQKEER